MSTHAKVLQWLKDQNVVLGERNRLQVFIENNIASVVIWCDNIEMELAEERINNFHPQSIGTPFPFKGHVQFVEAVANAIDEEGVEVEVETYEF